MDEAATKQTLRMIQLNDDYDKRIQNTLRQNARGVQDLHAAQQLSLTGTLANPFLNIILPRFALVPRVGEPRLPPYVYYISCESCSQ